MVKITEQANQYLKLFRQGKSFEVIAKELNVKYASVQARFVKFKNLGLIKGTIIDYTVEQFPVEVLPTYGRRERRQKQHQHIVTYKTKQEMVRQVYQPTNYPEQYIAQIEYYRYGTGIPPEPLANNFRLA